MALLLLNIKCGNSILRRGPCLGQFRIYTGFLTPPGLDKITLMDLSSLEDHFKPDSQNTLFHPAEIELNQVFSLVLDRIKEVNPSRIVFDSVSEMRLLAETALRYRRQILEAKGSEFHWRIS
ncbi:MAG TPA: hypothetical protein VNJ08_08850 [Bacteriovoracaceae bacterium]|nr:hypothetical protein [Bacteriovoracaceae bacterium]